jgi:hypothetical protein
MALAARSLLGSEARMAFKKPEKPAEPIGSTEHGPGCMCIFHRSLRSQEERKEVEARKRPTAKDKKT